MQLQALFLYTPIVLFSVALFGFVLINFTLVLNCFLVCLMALFFYWYSLEIFYRTFIYLLILLGAEICCYPHYIIVSYIVFSSFNINFLMFVVYCVLKILSSCLDELCKIYR